ncbi:MAG: hypothetical protein K0S54_2160 [Alphaproteobacteria bacterium]|jgi:hypothetical protein|nr:hypothetical protein [Alphaproteobacteria bacterium]
MDPKRDNDNWFQRLHRWRERNAGSVYLVLLSLVALLYALSYLRSN